MFDALADTDAVAVNMREVFDATGDAKRYYSALDNHYNYDGVLLTYRTLMKAINERLDTPLKVYEDRDLVFHTEEQEFFGSYSRRICNLQARKEHLVWAEPKEPVPFTREDGHVRVPANTFEQPDPAVSTYAGYMGGDIGETVIRTGRDDRQHSGIRRFIHQPPGRPALCLVRRVPLARFPALRRHDPV